MIPVILAVFRISKRRTRSQTPNDASDRSALLLSFPDSPIHGECTPDWQLLGAAYNRASGTIVASQTSTCALSNLGIIVVACFICSLYQWVFFHRHHATRELNAIPCGLHTHSGCTLWGRAIVASEDARCCFQRRTAMGCGTPCRCLLVAPSNSCRRHLLCT